MNSMRRGLVAASVVLALLTPQPAHSAETLLQKQDAAGDVRVFKAKGLRARARQTIDLRRAWVSRADRGAYRFAVKIRRVAGKRTRWDQMAFFVATKPSKTNNAYADVGFSHKPRGGAYAYNSRSNEWCNINRVVRRPAKRILSVKVPKRCAPGDGWDVRVSTYTGAFRSDAPAYSKDQSRLGRLEYFR